MSFDENSPIKTSSPYSASKAAADLLATAYCRTYGLPVTISRCSNNYGPYQFPEKLIPLAIVNALRDKQIPVYGSGENRRDWIYVEDHCSAIDLILRKGRPGEIYNVGGNGEMSNLEVVRKVLAALNKPEDLITFVSDRPGHDLRYAINAAKTQDALGWRPLTPFDDGLEKTIGWYLEHRDWWENILNGSYRSAGPPGANNDLRMKLF
jgi:dTDP-glucose 4,6-dehydratase